MVLADEINRAPAKTQSALLEAMQEGQVTVEGQRFELPQPFIVLATQNPLDLEGVFQAATQINEVTLSFIPKLLVLAVALYIGAGWMLKLIMGYSESLIKSIPSLIG